MPAREVVVVVFFFPNVVLKFQNIFKNTREKILFSLCKYNNEVFVLIN